MQENQQIIRQLCLHYLLKEKKISSGGPGGALDPVANFHIGNGALIYRLNSFAMHTEGSESSKTAAESFGLMVNYKYSLEDLLENSQLYKMDGTIPTDPLLFK